MYTRQVGATRNIGCCLLDNRLSRELLSQSRLSAMEGRDGYESSGNTRFDRALGMMLANLAGRFQVRPGFGFYDDSSSPNALALKESKFPDSDCIQRGGIPNRCRHGVRLIPPYLSTATYKKVSRFRPVLQ